MTNKFYTLDYVPHKLAYVYEVTKEEIKFLAFFNDKGNGMKAVKHSVSKKSKKDFRKPKKCYIPIPQVQKMINEALNIL
tara:strand:+ start:6049 stop:6285 length:237 start_codon:yes stop_codon:yes gene_type:complete